MTYLSLARFLLCASFFLRAAFAQSQWSVANYYVYDNMPYTSLSGLWSGITHLAIGDFHVAADGSLRYSFKPENYFPEAVSTAHVNEAKALVILSDTGATDNLRGAFQNNPTKTLDSIARLIKTYGFDGIQVDWETSFPYRDTQKNLEGFFKALRLKLGGSALIMADAFPAGGPYGLATQKQWNMANAYLDRLAIMTYDLGRQVTGRYSWFNAPLYNGKTSDSTATSVDQSVTLFLGSGSTIPASKLMLGIPFFGYVYSGVSSPRQSVAGEFKQRNYSDLLKSYDLSSAKMDRSSSVPWLPVKNGYITFDDEYSVRAKVSYAKRKGLGGWMVFNLFADYMPLHNPQHPLLSAIRTALSAPH